MMKSTFKIKQDNIDSTYNIEQCFSLNKGIRESIRHPFLKFVEGESKEISLNGVKICIRNAKQNNTVKIEVAHSFPFLKVQFQLEGKSEYKPKNDESLPVIIEKGEYNFFYLPKVEGILTYPEKIRKSVEIIFTEDFVREIFNENFDKISSDFGNALNKNIPFKMFEKSEKIPPNLLLIIIDIINCSYQKEIKEVYIISKLTEIFSYLFSEIEKKRVITSKNLGISPKEYKQIIKAEKYIKTNLQYPPTIKQLAVHVGINQNKLKRNFKKIFEKPIYTYITHLRMEKAKSMLLTEDLTVAEVAYAIGYKNPQHFTVAFKKKYQQLPSAFK